MMMQSLLAANQSIAKMQTIHSAKAQMQGTANILRMESKQDGGNEKKDTKADALDSKANRLMEDMMGESTKVNETLKPSEEAKEEEKAEEESKGNGKKKDTVTLSEIGAGYRGNPPKMNATLGEVVAYDKEGSKAEVGSNMADSTFQARA